MCATHKHHTKSAREQLRRCEANITPNKNMATKTKKKAATKKAVKKAAAKKPAKKAAKKAVKKAAKKK